MIIGITGGTGCGKTTALRAIADLGGTVLDCDRIYHELLATDRALVDAIGHRFPGCVCDGVLDRKKLGAAVFSDPQQLLALNAITHAAVKAEVQRRLCPAPQLAAIDAIALFESGLAQLCDVTVAVTAPRQKRIERLMARDGIDEHYAALRIDAQPSEAWFAEKCDRQLKNSGTEAEFYKKCLSFFREMDIMKL